MGWVAKRRTSVNLERTVRWVKSGHVKPREECLATETGVLRGQVEGPMMVGALPRLSAVGWQLDELGVPAPGVGSLRPWTVPGGLEWLASAAGVPSTARLPARALPLEK